MDFIESSARERAQSEGERDQLTEEERRDLCSVIQTRCFAHIRCLCANDGVIFENEWLKDEVTKNITELQGKKTSFKLFLR